MAYVDPVFDEDEDEQNENQGSEQVLAGESSELGQGGGAAAPAQAGQPSKSGSWTNLMSYVGANEGNDAQMGEKVKTGIEQRAQGAQAAGDQFSQRASQKIGESTVADSGIVDEVKNSPTAITSDAEKRAQFDKQWNAYYGGPKSASEVEGYGQTGGQYQKVEDRAKNAQTHLGRKDLLKDEYNRPNYSSGEKTLDSFILGAGSQGRGVLNDINQNYGNYASGWKDLVNSVGGNIQQAQATTDQTRQMTRDAVGGGIGQAEQSFQNYQNQLAQEATKNQSSYNDLLSRLSSGDSAAIREAGLDPKIVEFLNQRGDINKAVTAGQQRQLGDLVNDDELARYNALRDLGQTSGGFQDFTKTGSDGSYFDLDDGFITQARKDRLAQLEDEAGKKAAGVAEAAASAFKKNLEKKRK